jgi:hypothetical protein
MAYKHLVTLSTTSSQASQVLSALTPSVAKGEWIAVQCKGGVVRVETGAGSATALTTQGLRILPDQPPVEFPLGPLEDTIAVNSEDGTSACTVEVLRALRAGG